MLEIAVLNIEVIENMADEVFVCKRLLFSGENHKLSEHIGTLKLYFFFIQ